MKQRANRITKSGSENRTGCTKTAMYLEAQSPPGYSGSNSSREAENLPKTEIHIPVNQTLRGGNRQEDDFRAARKGKAIRKYDLRAIMKRAWKNFRKSDSKITFGEALHRAWLSAKAETVNEARIQAAKDAAGVQEATDTWSGWRKAGFEVAHGSRALFQAVLIWGSKGDGKSYTASFFGASQVQAINA